MTGHISDYNTLFNMDFWKFIMWYASKFEVAVFYLLLRFSS